MKPEKPSSVQQSCPGCNELLGELDRQNEFIALMAHQLKTPLTGIKWSLHMLLENECGTLNEEQRNTLNEGLKNNERMIALVDEMRKASRERIWNFLYHMESLSLKPLLTTIIQEFEPRAHTEHKSIVTNFPSQSSEVYADRHRLTSVFEILFDNALKYLSAPDEQPKSRTVTIRLYETDTEAVISLHNYGCTVREEEIPHIFEKFVRGSKSHIQDGSGLGLFTAQRIINDHGGSIQFESSQQDGTTVTVRLPLCTLPKK